ncbi:dehydrogenase [Streptomyces sviceus ATCC 29083]|uniref:Dehydrogenase n=1 Tax=Streptomyces sviceus (strain ATCC 29083 / DSM 924 / JCM 4929 / NBRC 13980 / NCIMB 11184 / NRRL 5439 / UC 5370) TaxID=463191 RepID=B5HTM3_STRX2|nr:dehydrogenase [Streptomyces sviceus ATCC 29083]
MPTTGDSRLTSPPELNSHPAESSGQRGCAAKVRGMTDDALACPECSRPLAAGGLVLSRRDDGQRVCRSLWRCAAWHTWWRWTDRPEEPLEVCAAPELFR